jgi:hypothetical protein
MNGRETSRVTRVEELQEVERLTASYLTEDDSVWPMAERCLQEITDAYGLQAVLRLPGFKADKVVLIHLNFGGVFNEENSFVGGNEFPENIQESCLASSRTSGDQNVFPP